MSVAHQVYWTKVDIQKFNENLVHTSYIKLTTNSTLHNEFKK